MINLFFYTTTLILFFFILIKIYKEISDDIKSDSVFRRRYPIIFRLALSLRKLSPYIHRYFLGESKGTSFSDREMSYIHSAADGQPLNYSLGQYRTEKDFTILHSLYPIPSKIDTKPTSVTIGEGSAQKPWVYRHRIISSAMGFSSLSPAAYIALSKGCKAAGLAMNSGEAGISPYSDDIETDMIFQVGVSGYLCRDLDGHYNSELIRLSCDRAYIKAVEIKLSQGAHPGKDGGRIPGYRLTPMHGLARGLMPFIDQTTPLHHPEIRSPSSLGDVISLFKKVTGKPVGIKFCLGAPSEFDTLIEYWKNSTRDRIPDFVTIDGAEGGTMQSSDAFLHYMGTPIKISLPMIHEKLVKSGLRDFIKIIASGKLSTPEKLVWAYANGADIVAIARGAMMAMGCIQAMSCNSDSCPSGVTNRDPKFNAIFSETRKDLKVASYFNMLYKDACEIAAACGVSHPEKITKGHIATFSSSS